MNAQQIPFSWQPFEQGQVSVSVTDTSWEGWTGKDAICKCGITGKHLNSSPCREKFCVIKTEYLILRSWTCLFRLWVIVFRVAERLLCLGAAARCTVCCDLKKQTRLLMEVTAAVVCKVSFYLCILWIVHVLTCMVSCLFLPACLRVIWKKEWLSICHCQIGIFWLRNRKACVQ